MNNEFLMARNDLSFILFDWLNVNDLVKREKFQDQNSSDYVAILDTYELLAKKYFAPHNKKNDFSEPVFDGDKVIINEEVGEALRIFADAGLVGATFPAEWGGLNLPNVIERAGMAYLLAANVGTASYPFLTIANANLLMTYGDKSKIEEYIPQMMEGKCFGTMCMSEPQAGSNLSEICTRAMPLSDGRYRLFGNKMWISGGEHDISENILHLVLAKIPDENGDLPKGVKGISLFAVPRKIMDKNQSYVRNDITLVGVNHKMGCRGTVNCVLNFGEGRYLPEGGAGAIGEIIGEPGKGLSYMFHMMNEARISVGLTAAALGYTGYLHSLSYAKTRLQGRSKKESSSTQVPILAHSDVRRMLLAQKTYASGALALCLYAAKMVDDIKTLDNDLERENLQALLDLLTPVVKSWPSQWGGVANDLAIQVHGGYGYTREYNVEQFYRDNRLNPIHEGTFGIQAIDLLGRKTQIFNGKSMAVLDERVNETISKAFMIDTLNDHAKKLKQTWSHIKNLTTNLHNITDEELKLANASNYLEAFGHMVIGWLILDQVIVIKEKSLSELNDFQCGKLATCDFFFNWEIQKIEAWLSVFEPIETTPFNMKEDWF